MDVYRRWMLAVSLLSVVTGCARQDLASYELRDEADKLPTRQRVELSDYLEQMFGTFRFPRMRSFEPDAKSEQEDASTATGKMVELVPSTVLEHGREIYTKQCASCHGVTGAGNGPAAEFLEPPPRDYRKGIFKFTSTPRGNKPRHEDLVRFIRHGAKGTSMPGFPWMPNDDLNAVIAYVKSLSCRGQLELSLVQEAEDNLEENEGFDPEFVAEEANDIYDKWNSAASQMVQPQTPMVPYNDKTIELGARAFVKQSCYKCHGIDGRGNPNSSVGKDDWGRVVYAANLRAGMLHGGRRPIDIYRRIHSGINGTPMPGFGASLGQQGELDTVWHLSHFITSIVEGRELPESLLKELAAEAEAAMKRELQGAAPEATTPEPPETDATETSPPPATP